MQALFDLIAGLLSALAAMAFAHFGASLQARPAARPQPPEVHRIVRPAQGARAPAGGSAPAAQEPAQA